MSVLKYLFEPFMLLFAHKFTVLGYSVSFLDIYVYAFLISMAGIALYKIFNKD